MLSEIGGFKLFSGFEGSSSSVLFLLDLRWWIRQAPPHSTPASVFTHVTRTSSVPYFRAFPFKTST